MRFRSKVIILLLALTLVTNGVLLWLSYRGSNALLFREIQSKVLSIAATAALLVDGDQHEKVRSAADEQKPEYAELERRLRQARDANRRPDSFTAYLYTMRPAAEPGKWAYVIDAAEPGPGKSHVGDPVEFESEDRRGFTMDEPRAENAFSRDQFGTWLSANAPVRDSAGRPVAVLGVDIDAARVIAQLRELLWSGLIALGVAGLVAIALSVWLSHRVSAPLAQLGRAVAAIGEGKLDTRVDIRSRDEFGEVGRAINEMAVALRERETLRGALARYVSRHVAENIVNSNALPQLDGERRRVTVLFCDIRNFTRLANTLSAEEVVAFLNEFFREMIEAIFTHRGTLDKLLGDGLMAFFGAPLDDPQHEASALRAALDMQARLARLREKWREPLGVDVACGIGLHSGEAIVGNVGSEERLDYTAIGDTVNIAARLEAATKDFQRSIILSEATASAVGAEFQIERLGDVTVRGVAQPVAICTVSAAG